MRVDAEKYRLFCRDACLAFGLSPQAAQDTARMLVQADLTGTFTHGTQNLLAYLQKIPAGGMDPAAPLTVVSESPSTLVLDGGNGVPPYIACEGLRRGMEKARQTGSAYVALRGSGHYGASGAYAAFAAEQGFFCLALSNTVRGMGAPGARGPVIGNSPLAYAVPAPGRHPICVDMATSNVAAMKVLAVQQAGGDCPPAWITDDEGHPLTHPQNGEWVLAPMGGFKGYNIAFLIELLCSVFAGGPVIDLNLWQKPEARPGVSHCFWLIDLSRLLPEGQLERQVQTLIDKTEATPPAEGCPPFCVPGDRGWARYDRALAEGLELPDNIAENARTLARLTGLSLDACLL